MQTDHTTGSAMRTMVGWLPRLCIAAGFSLCALVGAGAAASAGGWAVSTLDEVPIAEPGEPVDVGFTIRQHGVSPVDLDGVGISIEAADGGETYFSAHRDGPTGHYVATVTFPDAGEYSWAVAQGFFADHELGRIDVGAIGGGTGGGVLAVALRIALPTTLLALAMIAAFDVVRQRRRRRPALA